MIELLIKRLEEVDKKIDNYHCNKIWNRNPQQLVQLSMERRMLLKKIYQMLPVIIEGTLASHSLDNIFFVGNTKNGEVIYNSLGDITEYLDANRGKKVKIIIQSIDEETCNTCEKRFTCWTQEITNENN